MSEQLTLDGVDARCEYKSGETCEPQRGEMCEQVCVLAPHDASVQHRLAWRPFPKHTVPTLVLIRGDLL